MVRIHPGYCSHGVTFSGESFEPLGSPVQSVGNRIVWKSSTYCASIKNRGAELDHHADHVGQSARRQTIRRVKSGSRQPDIGSRRARSCRTTRKLNR